MNELNNAQKNELRNLIEAGYNLSEMRLLCGSLGVGWEDVSAETTRARFAQELVDYFERRGRLLELIDQVWYDRPTMIQNSELLELINYNDVQETHISAPMIGDGTGCWIGFIVVLVLALTNRDSIVVNQSVVYTLTRPTVADPWTIADSSP